MLKLKNVSKFYYSNGVIASGFSRVNLELDMGEFVVITGESGSGKSTLLNVLSGLDTYEEGEMYINGEETSHYNEEDFEEYRRKYVGNIFQNFNLVNSYTVYQNVELALLLNGESRKNIKNEIMEIIAKVGLTDFTNTKCSKLSGGQKQRVAIARAIAKETPIIVADEPTGNLDSKAAEEVMKILSEISKDKLVIIVTHNIEQVEKYATRLIKMHDGKILEDKTLKAPECSDENQERTFKDITVANRIGLGIRNAFNIPSKFILIFAVFLFIALAVAGTYSSFQKQEYEENIFGYNEFFNNTADNRIVINKPDRSPISDQEFASIEALSNIQRIAKDDMLVDYTQSITDKDYMYFFYGNFVDIKDFKGELVAGRMPEAPGEIIVTGPENDYYLSENTQEILESQFFTEEYDNTGERSYNNPIKIVGIAYNDDDSYNNTFYVGEDIMSLLQKQSAMEKNRISSQFEGQNYESTTYDPYFRITPSASVPKGEAYVSRAFNDLTERGNCIGKEILISTNSIYNKDSMTVTITATYYKNNFSYLMDEKYDEAKEGVVYVNDEDYNNLINKGTFQSSVFVSDVKKLDDTAGQLREMGFNTLIIRDSLAGDNSIAQMLSTIKTFVLAVLIIALFFISYFIIRIILKSRNSYYTTLRTLGASRRISKQLLDIELFVIATLAYALFMAAVILVYTGVITQGYIADLAGYLTAANYVIMYLVIIVMSYLISHRFAKKLFKDSVMNTYREEA